MKNKILLALVTVFLVDANAKDLPPVELFFCDSAMRKWESIT